MKKIVLLATFLVFGTGVLSAQEMFHFGIKGGVNFSTIGGDDFDDPDSRTSFNIGALAEFPISERFSIQPEVYYSGVWEPFERAAQFTIYPENIDIRAHWVIEGIEIIYD